MDTALSQRTISFETAGEHVRESVPRAAPDSTVEAVRRSLEGRSFASVADVAVLENERLVGLVRLRDLFAAAPRSRLRDVMNAEPAVVAPGVDQEQAAWHAVRHGDASLAVVDADGRFHGLIPPETILAVLLREHAEDLARLSGSLHGAAQARSVGTEAIGRRLMHRLPWLLVGLLGAYLATALLSLHEGALQANVALAFFLPGVVYIADAVGTQSETVVVRGLAVGVKIHEMMLREAATGLFVGVVLAALTYPVVLYLWGAGLAATVSLSLLASCSVATLLATGFPWLLSRLSIDPAFGSGPLATVLQDLLSILIYLAIALAFVG